MFGHDDLEFIGTREVHEAVPQLDTDSPRSSLANNPTKKQIESNNFSRCAELTPLFGSAEQALVLNVAWRKDALSSDEATVSAIISTAVGNATGLITAILVHCCLRGYYRTGKYQLTLSPRAPTRAQQEKMKRSDGYVYLGDDGKLHYVIKRSFRKPIKGNIDVDKLSDEKKEETGRGEGGTTHVLKKLKATLARGYCEAGEGKPQCPPDWEAAFLEITHKRGHTYSGKTSTNPLYRTCKTLSSFGARFGAIISAYLGVENPNLKRILSFIMSDVFCIVFGLFGIAYFFIRDVVLKIPPNTKHTYDLTGLEGWSKYAKTALTLGTVIGQGVGGLILAISNAASASAVTVSSFSISFWGGVVGVASFVASLIFVPLINWISSKYTKDGKGILTSENKNKYRNNYTRSGLTLGAGFGALFGLIIGNWCFGLIMAATIFSALGALIGAIVLSAYGYRIHRKLHGPLPPGKTDNDEDNDNSFDYVTRCTASVFGFIGAAVVCAINPAMALLLVPIGSAIASTLGWGIGILIMKRARSLPGNEIEKKATTMPWTQRLNTGSNIGSVIGGCIGLAFGFAGFILAGPASLIFSVSLFGAIGAVVGGLMAVLYDKHSRQL
ncbi:MAG TPA: hypothetical protein VLH77_06230, partial [Gammaproteobacteria bacterium]|nr:hypothetical protein [Gammaproteobacteria bacterium]